MAIKILDEKTANIIAAGEVIERPSNVVKELVENSIDASSTLITITLINSGVNQIIVSDNGSGISKEDAKLAFFRHATSKIVNHHDLFNLRTLGFRGEALASIASVSITTLQTSIDGKIGYLYKYKAGKLIDEKELAFNKGTTITVENLFFNTPVRLKYLKSENVELAHITDFVTKLALSNPHISFKLTNNNKTILNTNKDYSLLNNIGSIYGLDIVKNLLPFNNEFNGYTLRGYLSNLNVNKSRKNYITLIVNNRFVKNYQINNAIVDGYKTYIPHNTYPFFLLYIDIDPLLIDVNIHPQKLEVKISKEKELCDNLILLIKNTLESNNLIYNKEEPETKKVVISYDNKDFFNRNNNNDNSNENSTIETNYEEINYNENINSIINEDTNEYSKNNNSDFKEEVNEVKKETVKIPYMEYIGQHQGTYLIFQNDEGLFLIDQHAAQERIKYEYYFEKMGNIKGSKPLLIPYNLELSLKESIYLEENINNFNNLYFKIESSGINSFYIREIPIWLDEKDIENTLIDIIYFFINERNFNVSILREKLAIMIACKKSIKANTYINNDSAINLLNDLNKTINPYTCPHGRPTVIKITNYEIEKMFKRSI